MIILQFAVISLQFAVIILQFAVIDLQFAVIGLQNIHLLWNDPFNPCNRHWPLRQPIRQHTFSILFFTFLKKCGLPMEPEFGNLALYEVSTDLTQILSQN